MIETVNGWGEFALIALINILIFGVVIIAVVYLIIKIRRKTKG